MPSFLERIKKMFSRTPKLPAPEGEKKDNTDKKKAFRERVHSIVPGFKSTRTAKVMEIQNIRDEYAKLLEERKRIMATKEEIKEWLGMKARPTKTLDELCREADRLNEVTTELEEIYTRGQADITALTQDELLKFQRMQEINGLTEQENHKTAEILAVRQGLINVADTEKSSLDETLQTQYRNPKEFCENATLTRMIDFINAANRVNSENQPELSSEQETTALVQLESAEVKELITLPEGEYSPKVREALGRSSLLRTFVEKLRETDSRTGCRNEEAVKVPFKFEASKELEGEIIIEEQPEIAQQQTNGRG